MLFFLFILILILISNLFGYLIITMAAFNFSLSLNILEMLLRQVSVRRVRCADHARRVGFGVFLLDDLATSRDWRLIIVSFVHNSR